MNKKTIDIIKGKHVVPEALRQHHKDYLRLRREIRQALQEGPATIPEIAIKTGIPSDQTLYMVMTLRKFGEVETGELDDSDAYFYYKLKEK
ncbi:MAG: MarR family transcriptional regulator [Bacteroidetes bacterium]|nr:MAG: MarR family transcriptional regulator [Bacteroidota bacterium]